MSTNDQLYYLHLAESRDIRITLLIVKSGTYAQDKPLCCRLFTIAPTSRPDYDALS
jgi:hypothetical protein